MDCSPPASSGPGGFSRQEYWSGLPCPPPGDLTNSGIKPRSPTLQADSLSSEPPGKPKNTGVDSLSLLQRIFPTQESNRGCPALQGDSLPAELPGKSKYYHIYSQFPKVFSDYNITSSKIHLQSNVSIITP